MKGNESVFLEFHEAGLKLGIRIIWYKFYSWEIVSQIDFRKRTIHFEIPKGTITVYAEFLKSAALRDLKSFFATSRETIVRDSFFGWHRNTTNGESFGALKLSASQKKSQELF